MWGNWEVFWCCDTDITLSVHISDIGEAVSRGQDQARIDEAKVSRGSWEQTWSKAKQGKAKVSQGQGKGRLLDAMPRQNLQDLCQAVRKLCGSQEAICTTLQHNIISHIAQQ